MFASQIDITDNWRRVLFPILAFVVAWLLVKLSRVLIGRLALKIERRRLPSDGDLADTAALRSIKRHDTTVSLVGTTVRYLIFTIAVLVALTQIIGHAFDANGDPTATNVQIGNTAPDYRMGLVNDVTYKNFSLNVVLDYQHGGDIINLTQFLYDDSGLSADYGSPEWTYRMKGYNDGVMTPYIEDASFLKLRELSIRTTVPQRWVNRVGLGARNISVGVSGRNLLTWQKYSGLDPEVANVGSAAIRNNLDVAPYPPSRSFFFDFSVGF